MAVERIRTRESLATPFAEMLIGLSVVEGIVPFAIMLSGEALCAAGPFTYKRTFLGMGAQMAWRRVSGGQARARWTYLGG
jgi:hypothetical protein